MTNSSKPSGKFTPTLADKLAAMTKDKREAAARATAKLAQARQAREASAAAAGSTPAAAKAKV